MNITYALVVYTLDYPRLILSHHAHLTQMRQSGESFLYVVWFFVIIKS